jgi:RND family efflux transporter MFP subunit
MLLPLLFLGACAAGESTPRDGAVAIPVTTIRLESRDEPVRLTVPGEVVSARRIEVASKIAGRVLDLPVTEGTRVRAGDLLVRLDAPEIEAGLRQARAAEEAARWEAEVAHRQAERFRRLAASEVVTPRDLELAQLGEAGASAAYERAQAVRASSEADMSYVRVRSEADGVVVRRLVREGDLAAPGRPLLVVEAGTIREVRITLPTPLPWPVAAGDRAELRGSGGATPLPARVDRVAPGADHHVLEAFLLADAGLDLPSGTFVDVDLIGAEHVAGLRPPAEAFVQRGGLTGAFTVQNGRAVLRWLRLASDGRVLAGLAPGDSVVVAPPAGLEDGAPVEAAQ